MNTPISIHDYAIKHHLEDIQLFKQAYATNHAIEIVRQTLNSGIKTAESLEVKLPYCDESKYQKRLVDGLNQAFPHKQVEEYLGTLKQRTMEATFDKMEKTINQFKGKGV